ncbi:MAG: hypothetical protein IJ197_09325 [Bacteroidaceae bacterium]|nr:hypothetical protein [Bacteroidaceae bacterium]
MNDYELDELIMATAVRQETITKLNRTIMKDVRKRARREWLRQWGRIVAFSFGLPLLLMLYGLGIWELLTIPSVWPVRFCLLIPLATVLYFARHELKYFSIAEV